MFEDIELNAIQEENARELVKRLLNMVEQLSGEIRELRVENQRLRDENNRLKGEQGKPHIKGDKTPLPKADHSSEPERHKKRARHKNWTFDNFKRLACETKQGSTLTNL